MSTDKNDKYPKQHWYGHKRPWGKRFLNKIARLMAKIKIRKEQE